MNKSTKIYKKALEYYEAGYIDKAIDLCEESISLDIKNRAAIGLKGILHYLKGDLKTAKALWKLNFQMNKDNAAQKYLEDLNFDVERINYYETAVKYIKQLDIKEALVLLSKCSESDFNAINVNNALATCYMRQGNFEEAKKKIDKVLSIDKGNKAALENSKLLKNYGIIKYQVKIKSLILLVVLVILAVLILFKGKDFIVYVKSLNNSNKTNLTSKVIKKPTKINSDKPKNTKSVFPTSDFQNALANSDDDKIYDYISNLNNYNLNATDLNLINEGNSKLNNEGTEYFYKEGSTFYENSNYQSAINSFLKAYQYGANSNLLPDVLYFLAASYRNIDDSNNAVKYYVEYDNKFGTNGGYADTVLYNLAMIYKASDINKAKYYANKLVNNYPDSIYNNSNVQNILAK